MNLGIMNAFLKRWSRVRITPGTLLYSKDRVRNATPQGAPEHGVLRVSGTNPVQGRDHYDQLSPLRLWTTGGGR